MYASWLDVLSQNFQPGPLLNRKHPLVTAIGATGWCLKVRSVVNIEDPNPYWFVYAWRYFLLCLLAVGTLWTVIFPCGFPCSFRFNLSGIRDSLRRRESAVQAAQWFSDDFPIIGWFFQLQLRQKSSTVIPNPEVGWNHTLHPFQGKVHTHRVARCGPGFLLVRVSSSTLDLEHVHPVAIAGLSNQMSWVTLLFLGCGGN